MLAFAPIEYGSYVRSSIDTVVGVLPSPNPPLFSAVKLSVFYYWSLLKSIVLI